MSTYRLQGPDFTAVNETDEIPALVERFNVQVTGVQSGEHNTAIFEEIVAENFSKTDKSRMGEAFIG